MISQWKFPIRYKILLVLSSVVIAAVAFYLYLASRIFEEDKTLLVYELNETNVRTLAADLEANMAKTLGKMRLFGVMALQPAGEGEGPLSKALEEAAGGDGEFISLELRRAPAWEAGFQRRWPAHLARYGKTEAYIDELRATQPVPYDKVLKDGVWFRNATRPGEGEPPLMMVAAAVKSTSSDGAPAEDAVLVAYLPLERILESFAAVGVARTFAVDSEGYVLAHSDQSRVAENAPLKDDPLMARALSSPVRSEVMRYEAGGKAFIGSFYRLGLGGVAVGSRIEQDEAFAAARVLMRKSLLYAAIVITTAFLIALFFSHSLTEPIRTMLDATRRIASGDFSSLIRVKSHDELAALASSFNTMTVNLKQSREQIIEYSHTLEKKVEERTAALEAQNVAIREAQDALARTSRLAAVGEVAGRAAHEVLNPLTNITARLESMRDRRGRAFADDRALLVQIIEAWREEFRKGGLTGLAQALSQPSQAIMGKSMVEEDLENLLAVARDWTAGSDEQGKDLDFLLRESSRINRIVSGMRGLTRVSAARDRVSLRKSCDDALATMADTFRKHGIKGEVSIEGGDASVVCDGDELLQVLSNLLRNSLQAIGEARAAGRPCGEPPRLWLDVRRSSGEDGGPRVQLRVGDNGPGIPTEHQGRIFEASFTTKSVAEGTGLGLSICRRFVRAWEGEITLEKSVPAVATVFLIDLPEAVSMKEAAHG